MCLRDFDKIIQTSSFLQLPYNQVERLLVMNNILVNDEFNLLKTICKWIGHDLTTRSHHTKELLENVHYACLSAEEIQDVCANYQCVRMCEEAKTLLNIISCAKLDKCGELLCDEADVAKFHIEKPARKVEREYFLLCYFNTRDDYSCNEEARSILYHPTQIKISDVTVILIDSLEHKLFMNISLLSRFIYIQENKFAEIDHENKITLYEVKFPTFFKLFYIRGNLLIIATKSSKGFKPCKYYVVNMKTKVWRQCPTKRPLVNLKFCVHKGYIYIFGQNKYQYRNMIEYLGEVHSMKLSDNSCKSSLLRFVNHHPVNLTSHHKDNSLLLILFSQENIYAITGKMDLHKIVIDEGKVKKTEYMASIPVNEKVSKISHVVGTLDNSIIYLWVHSDTMLSFYTYDIEQNLFATKREDKIEEINPSDFTVLNVFNPLTQL